MEGTRVFVSGLPPSLTSDKLRHHFAQRFEVTDAHVIPNRRIGFVGFKGPDLAENAVKYFNKTFINMSKISVEMARPVDADNSDDLRARYRKHLNAKKDPPSLKRKRDTQDTEEDEKLQEYLTAMQPPTKSRTWADSGAIPTAHQEQSPAIDAAEEPTEDKDDTEMHNVENAVIDIPVTQPGTTSNDVDAANANEENPVQQNDDDWLRSKTSRLLGLLDDEDEMAAETWKGKPSEDARDKPPVPAKTSSTKATAEEEESVPEPPPDANIESIRLTGRLFIRNLPYNASEDDLNAAFSRFGKIEETHVATDTRHSTSKGFAYIQYVESDAAIEAYKQLDGKDFQGRLMHILPASSKKTYKLDEFEISKLPLKKQQQIKRKAEAASSTFSWNSLYMNTDAVMASVADRLGVSKSQLLDPTSSDAAVKQAHAETHVIQETKAYFSANGVNIESFKQRERGNTALLLKNFTYGVSSEDIRKLCEPFGQLTRLLMPPSGTIAIVEFAMPDEALRAFKGLAYKRIGDSILYVEKAPKNLFEGGPPVTMPSLLNQKVVSQGFSTSDTFKADEPEAPMESATLFVRNLNFTTTDAGLSDLFRPLDGFISAQVKTRPDPKKPGERLSMGFGFVEFKSRAQAEAALKALNGYKLDQHELVIKPSHKGMDAAEQRRREDNTKKASAKRTKIIIKNLPFQATKKDIWSLFAAYGQLRSVRVPKKFDRTARGFAFADFVSSREAENAMDALRNTHLLGRRLVLEFVSEEATDPEDQIKQIEKKVDAQVNKVKIQKLMGPGRKKFHVDADLED
ncbi:Multiple RNA-binding domain-containing protein 1 [Trichophyton interdigitale]|uniref:Multiple RNA-binding domain-containing protein 1 n=1 Tax=Trichophyton interdigitale TaxID=101480 RepID=A0A9P5CYN9_9EURO|nr:Multiple RNA-binding domain-containing protein 1 [Trichophyton interdigitale]KAF3894996.1 Multiple RNA-binding domain-containing protein 1 [Trichophyton interdigitale]KAG8208602.1 Multiple RNA-binding domain-containing protein 1 [Trichophyton interdigitale]